MSPHQKEHPRQKTARCMFNLKSHLLSMFSPKVHGRFAGIATGGTETAPLAKKSNLERLCVCLISSFVMKKVGYSL